MTDLAPEEKPRIRVPAGSSLTMDSFANFSAAMGLGTRNVSAGATYRTNFLTLNRPLLESGYRGSWIIAAACDIPADDMTKAGVDIQGDVDNEQKDAIQAALRDMAIWQRLASSIRWGRLFGGCVAIIMIKGQDPSTPLRLDGVQKGGFEGLMVMDRWVLNPMVNSVVQDFGINWGLPEFYETTADTLGGIKAMKIHHSRVLRFDGYELPYYQRVQNNGWGESVVERIYDRVTAYDSTFTGAAQLVYKAYLRTVKVEGLKDVIAAGGIPLQGLVAQFGMMRLMQSIEGLTLMDTKDEFETSAYSFGGVADIMDQQGQQLCGALRIPATRFFGTSPTGLNANGAGELRDYYDTVTKDQEKDLRRPLTVLLDVLFRSLFGKDPPVGFSFKFRPLWQTSDLDRATIAKNLTETVTGAVNSGLVQAWTGLQELRTSSGATGVWSHISDEEIEDAKSIPPASEIANVEHEGRVLGVEAQRQAIEEPDGGEQEGKAE